MVAAGGYLNYAVLVGGVRAMLTGSGGGVALRVGSFGRIPGEVLRRCDTFSCPFIMFDESSRMAFGFANDARIGIVRECMSLCLWASCYVRVSGVWGWAITPDTYRDAEDFCLGWGR